MNSECILIRYGELALKGKNQKEFMRQLMKNIKAKLKSFEGVKLTKQQGRLYIDLPDSQNTSDILRELKDVFGIVGFSPVQRVENNMDCIQDAALNLVKKHPFSTFKVVTKRANKRFPINSQQVNQKIGAFILSNTDNRRVNVHNPDLLLHIEIREAHTYIYGNDEKGLGGLPVGVSGKVMLFLSGGIDSPVAGYLALKRGVQLECIHFHSYPFTSKRASQKVTELAQILTRYGGTIRLLMVPFTDIQLEIKKHCHEAYLITIMRRMMVRIGEGISKKRKALALVTGDNLGQVASQTLESLKTINNATNQLILRPLIGMDKQEIISIAKKIETYETSILPFEDCCTIFLPKNPKTKPAENYVVEEEKKLNIEEMVEKAVANIEVQIISPSSLKENEFF